VKLTKPRLNALTMLAVNNNRWENTYDLGSTSGAMRALQRKGLVRPKEVAGATPTSCLYQLTDEGR